jgi:signal peptidase II
MSPQPSSSLPSAEPLWVRGALLSAFILAADQLSKWWVLNGLRLPEVGQIEVVPSVFNLTMVWNRGVSFGFLRADSEFERWGLVILSGVIAVVFAVWMGQAVRRVTTVALGLVIGGAIGNMIDRVWYGAVADFFDVSPLIPFFPWVFNVADSAITIGALILAFDLLKNPDPDPAPAKTRRSRTERDGSTWSDGSGSIDFGSAGRSRTADRDSGDDRDSSSDASSDGGDGGGGGD